VSRLPHLPLLPVVICVTLLALTYLGFSATHYVVHNYQLRRDEAHVRSDIDQLDQDHEQLVAVRDYLKSDEYVEDVARRVLGLVRPGDTLVIVSSSGPPATPTPAAGAATPESEWWKNLFVKPAAAATAAR